MAAIQRSFPRAVRAVATSSRVLVMGSASRPPHVLTSTGGGRKQYWNFHMTNQYFSWVADLGQQHKLAEHEFTKYLQSEIRLSYSFPPVPPVPENFPFEIEDIHGDQRPILLRRKLAGEKIEVEVQGPFICRRFEGSSSTGGGGDDEDDDSYSGDSDGDGGGGDGDDSSGDGGGGDVYDDVYVILRVKISKKDGKTLECRCWTRNGSIAIRHIDMDNCYNIDMVDFLMRGERQKYWRDFLARRGIDDGVVKFLAKYTYGKRNRDYTLFMKKIKKFVEE